MQNIRILTAGDSSLLIEFGKEISPEINRKISATIQLMKEQHIEGVVDMIPAFCSLLVKMCIRDSLSCSRKYKRSRLLPSGGRAYGLWLS